MTNELTRDNLKIKLQTAADELLVLAQPLVWNKLSPNYLFISSPINDDEANSLIAKAHLKPQELDELLPDLTASYSEIYDINLFIYKASRNLTIIDIRCYYNVLETTTHKRSPFLHSKVAIPIYIDNNKRRLFDVNWELGTPWHRWEMFIFKVKYFLGIKSR